MPNLLLLASGVGLGAATAALWVQRWRRADHRFFAGLVSIAVTMSLFSVVTWAEWAFKKILIFLGVLKRGVQPAVPRLANGKCVGCDRGCPEPRGSLCCRPADRLSIQAG